MKFLTTIGAITASIFLNCGTSFAGVDVPGSSGVTNIVPAAAVPAEPTPTKSAPVYSSAAPENVFLSSSQLPVELRRVLLLPLACDDSGDCVMASGCETLDPVLRAALTKAGRFEVVVTSPEVLRTCTGKMSWTGTEVLPSNFLSNLKQVYGCDAVMFCQLTTLRSSAPMAIGWRLKLVDVQTGRILWAADTIYDAANLKTAKEAEKFQEGEQPNHNIAFEIYSFVAWCIHVPTRTALDDQWTILHSIQYFGRFSAENMLETLPAR